MHDHANDQELKDRLSLIETMIAEGRRHTESWGWTFILWGVVLYVAMAWAAWGRNPWAWPITIVIGIIVMAVGLSMKGQRHPPTTLSRALGSVWIAVGVSMFVLFFALGMSGRLTDQHVFMAILATMLGIANGASGLMLRWKVQLACGVVWWAAAVGICFGSDRQSVIAFLAAIFLCQIVFGIYGMIAEAQMRKQRGVIHA